jgi:glycosyltransferase involved in cell wall biosynthesis
MKKSLKKFNKNYISIITVVLNAEKTIERTIKSIISQSYTNYEIIIIDGGSTDGTIDIIKKYKKKISYWISEKDQGIYHAMNKGIKKSSGNIIGILNADDYYLKNALKTVNEYFNRFKKIEFLFGSVKKNRIMSGFYPEKISYRFNIYPGHSAGFFIKKKTHKKVGLYNNKFKYSADLDLIYRLIVKHKICGISTKKSEVTGVFSMGGISNSSSYLTKLKEEALVRLHNKQNIIYVIVLSLLHTLNYIYNKSIKL